MNRKTKQAQGLNYLVICLSLMAAVGFLVSVSWGGAGADEPTLTEARKIVAKINGRPVYEERLKPEMERVIGKYKKYSMRKDTSELVKLARRKALDKIINDELIIQESRKLTIEDLEKKVEQRLKATLVRYGTEEQLAKQLKSRNLTMEDLRQSAESKVYVDEYLKRQGILEPVIPEERIKEVYNGDSASYMREETVKVRHILIGVDAAEKKEEARQEAEKIRNEIVNGKDFAKLAIEHSDCNSAAGGGELRYIKKGYMPPEFEQVAFTLEKKTVSEVVGTKFGYHIIEVLDKKPAGRVPYEDVKEFIKKYLQQEESQKKLAAHIAELKSGAEIEILLAE